MTDLLNQFSDASLGAFSSRRDALRRTGQLGLGAAIAAIPFLKPGRAQAQSTSGDLGILNFALTLEYLERSFYRQAVSTGLIPAAVRPLYVEIRDNEAAHVTLLRGAISGAGGDPVDYTDSDFTFTPFLSSYANIATLAQGLEDTGVRAYKGQAAAISNKDILTTALQIHSVEARHAAAIRRLEASPATKGWIPDSQPSSPGPIQPVYLAGSPASAFPAEGNTTQGGFQLTSALSGYTATEISEAFDEPLDRSTVLAIAGQFISGQEGDGND